MSSFSKFKTPEFCVLLALIAGVLLRIFYLLFYRENMVFYASQIGEANTYLELSEEIIFAKLFNYELLYHSSLYTFIVTFFRIFLGTFRAIYLFQLLLGLLNIYLVFYLTSALFNKKSAAVASWIYVMTPLFMFYESKLNVLTLTVSCALVLLISLARISKNNSFVAYGTAALSCAFLYYLLPYFYLIFGILIFSGLIFSFKKIKANRSRIAFAVILFMVFSFPFYIWQNMTAEGAVFAQKGLGLSFYRNNMLEDEKGYFARETSLTDSREFEKARKIAEMESRRIINESEIDMYFLKKRLSSVKNNPAGYFNVLGNKTMELFSIKENSREKSFAYESSKSLAFYFPFIPSALILFFGIIFLGNIFAVARAARFPIIVLIVFSALAFFLVGSYADSKGFICVLLLPLAARGLTLSAASFKENKGSKISTLIFILAFASFCILFQTSKMEPVNEKLTYFNFATAHEIQGEYETALAWYEMAVTKDPDDLPIMKRASLCAIKGSNFYAAERLLYQALALDANSIDLLNNLGLVYLNTGRLKKAEAQFIKILELKKFHGHALFNLGTIYNIQGKTDAAINSLKRIPEWAGPYSNAMDLLAQIYASKKDYRSTVKIYEALIQKHPNNRFYRFKADEIKKLLKNGP